MSRHFTLLQIAALHSVHWSVARHCSMTNTRPASQVPLEPGLKRQGYASWLDQCPADSIRKPCTILQRCETWTKPFILSKRFSVVERNSFRPGRQACSNKYRKQLFAVPNCRSLNSLTQMSPSSECLPEASSEPALNPRSCITCRRRKVSCDNLMPCSRCKRAQIACIFPPPGRRRARRPLAASDRLHVPDQTALDLNDLIRKTESVIDLLRRRNAQPPETHPAETEAASDSTTALPPAISSNHTASSEHTVTSATGESDPGPQPGLIDNVRRTSLNSKIGKLISINERLSTYISDGLLEDLNGKVGPNSLTVYWLWSHG